MYCTRSEKGRCMITDNILLNDESCILNTKTKRCNENKLKIKEIKENVFFTKKYSNLSIQEQKQINKKDLIKIILFFDIIQKNITKQTKEYMYDLIYDFFNNNNITYNPDLNDLLENCFLNRIQLNDFSSENVIKECKETGKISNYISYIVNEYCLNKKENDYKLKHYHIPYIIDKINIDKNNICLSLQNKLNKKIKTNFNSIQEFYEYSKTLNNGKHILLNNLQYKHFVNKIKKVIIQDDKNNYFEIVDIHEYEELIQ
jgi:hypothetical protein